MSQARTCSLRRLDGGILSGERRSLEVQEISLHRQTRFSPKHMSLGYAQFETQAHTNQRAYKLPMSFAGPMNSACSIYPSGSRFILAGNELENR